MKDRTIIFRGSVSDLATDVAWVLEQGELEGFVTQLRAKMRTQDDDPSLRKIRHVELAERRK